MLEAAPHDDIATVPPSELHERSAERLIARYRRLLWLIAAPVFVLLATLALWQSQVAQRAAVNDLERRSATYHAAVEALARGAADHVADLRTQLERELMGAPHAPDVAVRGALSQRLAGGKPDGYTLDNLPALVQPGLAQLLWLDTTTPPDDGTLWRLQTFAELAEMVHNRRPDFTWSYYLGWPQKHIVLYPWVPSRYVVERTGRGSLLDSLPEWYGYEVFSAGLPEKDASRRPYWTASHVDVGGEGPIVSHAAPVYAAGQFRGVVAADIKLGTITSTLATLPRGPGRWWVVSERGEVLAGASAEVPDAAQPPADDATQLPAGLDRAGIDRALLQSKGRVVEIADQRVVVLDVASAPWTLVFALSDREVLAQVLPGLVPLALLAIALLAMFLHGQVLLRRRVIEPALKVMGYLDGMSRDESTPEPQLGARWQPWVQVVTATFRAQREARARERRSEAFKSAIVDNALAAIVATDSSGRIVEFNPSAESMFGRSRASVLGQLVADVIIPERYRAGHDAGMQRMREGGPPRLLGKRVEMQALRADGSEFPVEMVLWRAEVDSETHYTASISDVSERRNAAQQIERQREALRQSEKLTAMGSLLAGVAHELNNPLAIVMGRANLLEEKCEFRPDLKADAQHIRQAAERCGRIVRTFLNMARSKPAERSSVSLNELARAAADMLGYSYRSHGIELELELDPVLPRVAADGDQIGQVVLNLLVNAQQALSGASGERRVWVRTGVGLYRDARRQRGEQRVWLCVMDTGPGVSDVVRQKLFEPFFTTKPEGMGTGLGLAVSRSLAREHGGDLLLDAPEAGRGASFRLSLPLSGEPGPVSGPVPLAEPEQPSLWRVLVVDDEVELADLMRDMLESGGYEVATAESGAVALELLDTARFDAIVSDLRMPEMDGAAFWREILVRHPTLARRVLFVTGDTLSRDASEFLVRAHCSALDKPFSKSDLLAKVAELLD